MPKKVRKGKEYYEFCLEECTIKKEGNKGARGCQLARRTHKSELGITTDCKMTLAGVFTVYYRHYKDSNGIRALKPKWLGHHTFMD